MSIFLQILFWGSAIAVVYSYIIYPKILAWLAKGKQENLNVYSPTEKEGLPYIFLVMAVYNEEKVLEEKLKSVYETDYPVNRFQLLIGSDNSTDKSHQIIGEYAAKYGNIHLEIYGGRNGKIRIVNQLIAKHQNQIKAAPNAILLLTDANVMFTPNLLYELSKHFKNPSIGLVGANVLNIGVKNSGISFQEKWYIQRENVIKHYEGKLWGSMMGAFGACYAMRANLFIPVPQNFIVDDFYLTLKVIEQKYEAIKELKAVCYEDVSDDIFEEYRRKKRISAGNFQNLKTFMHLLWPNKKGVALSFWSHKVLRWLGPLFIIGAFVGSLLLAVNDPKGNLFYVLALLLQMLIFCIPIMDTVLKSVHIHIKLFRFITYFYLMNIALFIGLFNYLKGIKSNVWKPTKRN